ncbi:hypothetical protein [Alkalicoccobacillus porphyridii]|nr:hypothetical protein [Alkalicoccobacillus porphyridii]
MKRILQFGFGSALAAGLVYSIYDLSLATYAADFFIQGSGSHVRYPPGG